MKDVAIPGDARVAEKEVEKLEKYQLITDKFIKMRGKESRHCAVVNRALGEQGLREVCYKV